MCGAVCFREVVGGRSKRAPYEEKIKCRSLTAEAVRNDERARVLYRRNLGLLRRLPKANSYSYASASTGSLRLASHAG